MSGVTIGAYWPVTATVTETSPEVGITPEPTPLPLPIGVASVVAGVNGFTAVDVALSVVGGGWTLLAAAVSGGATVGIALTKRVPVAAAVSGHATIGATVFDQTPSGAAASKLGRDGLSVLGVPGFRRRI